MVLEFKNSNGKTYKVLRVQTFNEADKEYYTNSWQKYRVALLKGDTEYVVANYLGEDSWGHGYYTNDETQAVQEYDRVVAEYLT